MKLMNLFKKRYDLVVVFREKREVRTDEYFAIREILESHHIKGEVVEIYSDSDYVSIKVVVVDNIQMIRRDLIERFGKLVQTRLGRRVNAPGRPGMMSDTARDIDDGA